MRPSAETARTASRARWLGAGDRAVLRLDLSSALRDGVLMLNILASIALVAVVAGAGVLETALGLQNWRPWIPTLLALTLASGPGGPAMIFGSILIEERETGVGSALRATPTPRARLALLRIGGVTSYIALWLSLATAAILASWPGAFAALFSASLAAALPALAMLILALALLGGAAALAMARFAANRIEALAAFKAISVILALPVALFLGAGDAWWRPALQALPTGPAMEALARLCEGQIGSGTLWALGAALYAAALLALAVRTARR